ncbi:MAG: GNAT family N-acetyltransferase [Polyangiaceae bacterium]|nr:GNAT family N-acetyltransferase [Polyangiaceae bacterium]
MGALTGGAPVWRLAAADEDEAIVALAHQLYAEDPSPEPVPDDHTRRTLAALRKEPLRGRAVVLASGDRIVGYSLLVSYWSNELGGETCEIDELYVAPDARGGGHGSSLLRMLADGCELWPRPAVALCLQVTPDNERARSLYRRLGFTDNKNTMMRRRLS